MSILVVGGGKVVNSRFSIRNPKAFKRHVWRKGVNNLEERFLRTRGNNSWAEASHRANPIRDYLKIIDNAVVSTVAKNLRLSRRLTIPQMKALDRTMRAFLSTRHQLY